MKEAQNISWVGKSNFSSYIPHIIIKLQFCHSSGKHVVFCPSYAPLIYIYEVFYLVIDPKPRDNSYNLMYPINFFIYKNVLQNSRSPPSLKIFETPYLFLSSPQGQLGQDSWGSSKQ